MLIPDLRVCVRACVQAHGERETEGRYMYIKTEKEKENVVKY